MSLVVLLETEVVDVTETTVVEALVELAEDALEVVAVVVTDEE